ncbi:MAG: glucose-6-phosphate isomerase, partial [Parvibaculales bacterium]
LSHFGLWYRQLWAESLGKKGKGTLPVHSPCPLDHHSQLQLYAEGANDKIYSILTITGEEEKLPMPKIEKKELEWLSQKTATAMVSAQAQGTRDALDALNRPIRGIKLHGLGEQQIGALLMHFMLETILTAALMNINAFDQQGVEDSKRRAKAYMQKG